jgi:hypothetical protein
MATQFGPFTVELDLEANILVVVNEEMKWQLHIGGDQVDALDLESNYLNSMEGIA